MALLRLILRALHANGGVIRRAGGGGGGGRGGGGGGGGVLFSNSLWKGKWHGGGGGVGGRGWGGGGWRLLLSNYLWKDNWDRAWGPQVASASETLIRSQSFVCFLAQDACIHTRTHIHTLNHWRTMDVCSLKTKRGSTCVGKCAESH